MYAKPKWSVKKGSDFCEKKQNIGRTTYITNGKYQAERTGISLPSALFRLMEKDLLNTASIANAGRMVVEIC